MLNEFKQYLLGIGKSENTALNYCDKVKLYFKWCLDSFGSEPQQLYRANVLDYISYMKTIKRYSPIHEYYEPEELVGKTCIAITNLPPRPMMGIDSCGMLISAVHHEEGVEKLHLLMVDDHIPAGAKLY